MREVKYLVEESQIYNDIDLGYNHQYNVHSCSISGMRRDTRFPALLFPTVYL